MLYLREQFGEIDIYLFDQLLRGRIGHGMRILDAGCGEGRNLVYLLREGYEVYGVDRDAQAIAEVQRRAALLAPALPIANFQVARLEDLPYADAFFDVVICNAVLHFAENDRQFRAMVQGIWRVLQSGGLLFCRLASSIGMEKRFQCIAGRRFLLPDRSERYLVDAALLEGLTAELGGRLADPIKTTLVQNQRCMTTWVVRKT
jgi:tellurite methyltransferase